MSDKETVWVLLDPDDELDHILLTTLQEGMGSPVTVEGKERVREEEGGIAERFLRSVVGDDTERESWVEQLRHADPAPSVVITTDPDDLSAMAALARHGGPRPIRVGISREPRVAKRWNTAPCDLLAVLDSEAASRLRRRSHVRITGVPVSADYAPVEDTPRAREEESLSSKAHVVLISADAFAPHELNQVLVQLTLVQTELEVVFEVEDPKQADELRRTTPAYAISASLIPVGSAGSRYWSLAHLIIGRPTTRNIAVSRAVSVPLLAAPARRGLEEELAEGLVASGSGRAIESLATLAVDVDVTLEPRRYESLVEAMSKARVEEPEAAVVEVIEEALKGIEAPSEMRAGLPEKLERISIATEIDSSRGPAPLDDAARAATEVRERSEAWRQRARIARKRGDEELAVEADKRAAHHSEVLERLLKNIRSVDDSSDRESENLDDELEALRRKIVPDRNVEQRLRSLEVDDELRALKERLEQE